MNTKILIAIGILIIGFGIFSYATANDFASTPETEMKDVVDFVSTIDSSSTVSIPLQDGTTEKITMDISKESFLYIFTKMSENVLVTLNGKEIILPYKTVISTESQLLVASANGFKTYKDVIVTTTGTSKEIELTLDALQEIETTLPDISEEEQNQIDKDDFEPYVPPVDNELPTPTEEITPTDPIITKETRPSSYVLQNIMVRSKLSGTNLASYVLKSGMIRITSSSNILWDGEKKVNTLDFNINSDGYIASLPLMSGNKGFYAEPGSKIIIKVVHANIVAYEKSEIIPTSRTCFVARVLPIYQRIQLMGKLESTYSLDKIAKITISKIYLDQKTDVAFNLASISRYATDPTANVYIKTESDSSYRFIGVYPADGSTRYFATQSIKLKYTPTPYKFNVLVRYMRADYADADLYEFTIKPSLNGQLIYGESSFKEIPFDEAKSMV